MPAKMDRWTVSQLHRLPDDGNKHELVQGKLFVTPPPTHRHETIISRLHSLLEPYVQRHHLGRIYRPRAVLRVRPHVEVEPDLFVSPLSAAATWEEVPRPILIVEVTSETTRRRDHVEKRQLYVDLGIPVYWLVDLDERDVRVVRPGHVDAVADVDVVWDPEGASEPLRVDVRSLLDEAGL